jgi:hypothetical protein
LYEAGQQSDSAISIVRISAVADVTAAAHEEISRQRRNNYARLAAFCLGYWDNVFKKSLENLWIGCDHFAAQMEYSIDFKWQ